LANELGIQSHIRWLGFVDNLSPWLQAADAYVLTSLWEGLPVGVLEASAHGLPVVATDASGVHDALPENCIEWLAPINNAEVLGAKMQRMMLLTQEERKEIGVRNFKFAQANFSLNKILNQWEALYGKLLTENRTPRRWSK
jgi:glycosyltransferase involved in cell wall biosynthesis